MSLLRSITDLLLPRRCVICGRRLLVGEEVICVTCDLNLPRLQGSNLHIMERFQGRAEVERVTAFLYYTAKSSMAKLLYAKYHHRRDVARKMGRRMAINIQPADFFHGIGYIVPVPLTKGRRRERGYNQCEEMALGVSEVTGIPVIPDCLKRTNFRVSQTSLDFYERLENVKGCFSLNDERKDLLKGRHVLLLDDVITSGATSIECSNVLHSVPDVKVSVLALAVRKRL